MEWIRRALADAESAVAATRALADPANPSWAAARSQCTAEYPPCDSTRREPRRRYPHRHGAYWFDNDGRYWFATGWRRPVSTLQQGCIDY